ncbi:hypothetical protein GC194_04620 [bacterium]|nr:hypothetical protein [bacterium]
MYHVECFADEHILKCFGIERKAISHHNDKGRVMAKIKKLSHQIAMIDEDPFQVQPTHLQGMRLESELHDLRLLIDTNQNKVIALCPNLEFWLQKAVKKSSKQLGDYFSENDPKYVHKVIHHQKDKLALLCNDLLLMNNPFFLTLQSLLLQPA